MNLVQIFGAVRQCLFRWDHNNEDIYDVYANALVSVSPGYVGLSLTQSLSFGVPMLIAIDEAHVPEIDAALD